ncbi:MAG: hypothetical protein LBF74_07400 [Treponema sp.]|nr:hypothetical protein [Treponema sp.]
MTVSELAKALKISVDATRKRIETAGIQPITREAVYDPKVLEILRNVRMGRPHKARSEEPAKPVSKSRAKGKPGKTGE